MTNKVLDKLYKYFIWIIVAASIIAYLAYRTIRFDGDIESVVLTIPITAHGFYSSLTFKNTISASLSIVNNSDLPVLYIKNAVAVNDMTLDANTRNNLLIYNDGININIIQLRVEL